jgi:hypothetical protein
MPAASIARGMSAQIAYSERRGRSDRKTMSRGSEDGLRLPRRAPSWLIGIAGGLSLVLSFFITLELTKPSAPSSPAVAALASSFVSDGRTMMSAVKAAGLKGSQNVKGAIDEIEKLGGNRVWVKGWAAEIGNAGAPLGVVVFVDGASRLTTQTKGARLDVVQALGISDAATAANVSFQGSLTCRRGQKLFVVAVTDGGAYGYFSPRACP